MGFIIFYFISAILFLLMGWYIAIRKTARDIRNQISKCEKYLCVGSILDRWLELYQEKKNVKDYVKSMGWRHVSIYGMGKIGMRLLDELSDSDVTVEYVIDRRYLPLNNVVRLYSPDDNLPKTDVIIVTIVDEYDDIEKLLNSKCDCTIISIAELLYLI